MNTYTLEEGRQKAAMLKAEGNIGSRPEVFFITDPSEHDISPQNSVLRTQEERKKKKPRVEGESFSGSFNNK
ncbi:MAG: hypothetical protein F6K39_43815 [Okeania sp. SIO3B3]|nr:hypothetical protein [Okeania sp. SIO3B3]